MIGPPPTVLEQLSPPSDLSRIDIHYHPEEGRSCVSLRNAGLWTRGLGEVKMIGPPPTVLEQLSPSSDLSRIDIHYHPVEGRSCVSLTNEGFVVLTDISVLF
ncbi:hypothetical protein CEXT_263341 [Caerostris extrusa]|uniref:Uncharacterized protein n=1 Tax=Caerostris extrusa TaxID=172846 RepID=A0AAV4XU46_CAEEX|nr:hypothetical protein CEXT_263341 [Caerostris extrusa]